MDKMGYEHLLEYDLFDKLYKNSPISCDEWESRMQCLFSPEELQIISESDVFPDEDRIEATRIIQSSKDAEGERAKTRATIFGVEVSDSTLYDCRYNHETLSNLIGWQHHNSQYGHKQPPPQWLLDAIRLWFAPIPAEEDRDGSVISERLAAVEALIGDHGNNINPYPKNEWVYAVKEDA